MVLQPSPSRRYRRAARERRTGSLENVVVWHDYAESKRLAAGVGPKAVMVRNGLAGMHHNPVGTLVHDLHNVSRQTEDMVDGNQWNEGNATVTGPDSDGFFTVTADADSAFAANTQSGSLEAVASANAFTMAAEFKNLNTDWVQIRWANTSVAASIYFQLTGNGAVGTASSGASGTIELIEPGVYLCKAKYVGYATINGAVSIRWNVVDANGSETVSEDAATKMRRTRWQRGLSNTYLHNTGTATKYDQPVFPHDPVTGKSRGLRIVGGYTQLLLNTEDLATAGAWTNKGSPTESLNSTVAPDGTTTADTIGDDNASGREGRKQDIGSLAADTLTYCFSGFALKDSTTSRFPAFFGTDTGGYSALHLNTQTGAIADDAGGDALITSGVVDAVNYRRWQFTFANSNETSLTFEMNSAGATVIGTLNNAGQGSIVSWGYNVTKTAFPMPYMPGTTAAVVRVAETCITDITGLLPNDEVTIVIEGRTALGLTGGQTYVQLDDGAESNNLIRVNRASDGDMFVAVFAGSSLVFDAQVGTAVANDTDFTVALTAKAGRFTAAMNGGSKITDDAGAFPTGLDTMRTGHNSTPAFYADSTIKSVKIYRQAIEAFVDEVAAA